MIPDSSGKKRLMSGRAMSSVTRPPPSARSLSPADRPLVEALHVLDLRLPEQRTEQPVHEARLDVADVGVDPGHDVAIEHMEALPQRLALPDE